MLYQCIFLYIWPLLITFECIFVFFMLAHKPMVSVGCMVMSLHASLCNDPHQLATVPIPILWNSSNLITFTAQAVTCSWCTSTMSSVRAELPVHSSAAATLPVLSGACFIIGYHNKSWSMTVKSLPQYKSDFRDPCNNHGQMFVYVLCLYQQKIWADMSSLNLTVRYRYQYLPWISRISRAVWWIIRQMQTVWVNANPWLRCFSFHKHFSLEGKFYSSINNENYKIRSWTYCTYITESTPGCKSWCPSSVRWSQVTVVSALQSRTTF